MFKSFRSSVFVNCWRSVRLSSALRTAASTSTVTAWNCGGSTASMCVVQKSGEFGSRTRVRNASSDVWICASLTMTASSRWATSDSASTMSIGGVVPISTRARVLRSDSCASSSDCCCTRSDACA